MHPLAHLLQKHRVSPANATRLYHVRYPDVADGVFAAVDAVVIRVPDADADAADAAILGYPVVVSASVTQTHVRGPVFNKRKYLIPIGGNFSYRTVMMNRYPTLPNHAQTHTITNGFRSVLISRLHRRGTCDTHAQTISIIYNSITTTTLPLLQAIIHSHHY